MHFDKMPLQTVLDVGVGDGRFARYLQGHGHRVVAIDIVPEAFWGLPDDTERHTLDELFELPSIAADCGVCHLVIQHCDQQQASHLLSGLRPHIAGTLSVQVCGVPSHRRRRIARGQHYEYTLAEFRELAGGYSVEHVGSEEFPDHVWHYVHLTTQPFPGKSTQG